MLQKVYQESPYLEKMYTPVKLKQVVRRVNKNLRHLIAKKEVQFDGIAFTGSSGAAIAFPLSYAAGWKILHVRKTRDDHGLPIESHGFFHKVVIIDDFISSGATMRRVLESLNTYGLKCTGIMLYNMRGNRGSPQEFNGTVFDDIPVFLV